LNLFVSIFGSSDLGYYSITIDGWGPAVNIYKQYSLT